MLRIPAKYKRCGIKIKCLTCKWQLSDTCKLTGKGIHLCPNKDKHRFSLQVCVPKSKGSRRTRIIETRDFSVALIELEKFKKELSINNYHKAEIGQTGQYLNTWMDYAAAYLNSMSGENTPAILIRQRSKEHIEDVSRILLRFGTSLKKAGYNYKTMRLEEIGDNEVSVFHEYLLNQLNLKARSYNKHIGCLRTFYNWVIRVKDYKGSNPFNHVELKQAPKSEKAIITKEEFNKLIQVTTYQNGFDARGKNVYRAWLPVAYKLALETGLRREELFHLKWKNIQALDDSHLVFNISNIKVNRIQSGNSDGRYQKNIPITKSLFNLLVEQGYNEKKGSDMYIIERGEGDNLYYMMDSLSRSFTHFIKLASNRKLEFKILRKTYITYITMALGTNAKLFTGHSNDEILKGHYLNEAFIAGKLSEFVVF